MQEVQALLVQALLLTMTSVDHVLDSIETLEAHRTP